MKQLAFAALALLSACAGAVARPQAAECPPAGYDRARLEGLKASRWQITDDVERNRLARALTACLASPDPALRDGIAFEGLQSWLRARQLSTETMLALESDLEARMRALEGPGFERPFAALVMSEVARADRVEAYMPAETRARLLDASIAYLTSVRDYRGFDEREGYRHGVAHGADIMLQLALNPALGKPELERIRDAVATQITPREHFYIYGESERLARPILYIAQRGLISETEWTAWFAQIAAPAPFAAWGDAFQSQTGLAKKHNIAAFVQAIYLNARLSQNTNDDALLPGAEAALRALP